jgi:hypothetical protein
MLLYLHGVVSYPQRVQSRVRFQANTKDNSRRCKVALQISANPENKGTLTGMEILVSVPPSMNGETATTNPPAARWNAPKRCLEWAREELPPGSKFQIQALFAVPPSTSTTTGTGNAAPQQDQTPPEFPILVRCHCMYAQLSDIDVRLRSSDNGEDPPIDITMKIARRFRISHREKP